MNRVTVTPLLSRAEWGHGDDMATRVDPSFKVRMPGDLRRRIDEAARRSGRSINNEIVSRLEESFLERQADTADELRKSRIQEALVGSIRAGQIEHIYKKLMMDNGGVIPESWAWLDSWRGRGAFALDPEKAKLPDTKYDLGNLYEIKE